jgi:hypothetical protein
MRFTGWTWFAGGGLKAFRLLREKHWVVALDDANRMTLLDSEGTAVADWNAPNDVVGISAAENGERVFAVDRDGDIHVLDAGLEPIARFDGPADPIAIACDPLGTHIAVATLSGLNGIMNNRGRATGERETRRPLKHLAFVPSTGEIIGAAENGSLACFDYRGREIWIVGGSTSVGDMAIDGNGSTILLACFGMGLERLDGRGDREGTYRLEGAPARVAIDFEGSQILIATLERELLELNFDGVIRNRTELDEQPLGVALDPLGRYAVVAFGGGRLRFDPLDELFSTRSHRALAPPAPVPAAPTRATSSKRTTAVPPVESVDPVSAPLERDPFDFDDDDVEEVKNPPRPGFAAPPGKPRPPRESPEEVFPDLELKAVESLEEAASAVLSHVPGSNRVALFSSGKTLRIVSPERGLECESEVIEGTGRAITVGSSWMAALTDMRIVAFDPSDNSDVRCTLSTVEISHLELFDRFGEAAVVETCEYVTRFRFPEDVIWKMRAPERIEGFAIQAKEDLVALTTEDRALLVYDAAGKQVGRYRARKPEAMMLTSMREGWVTACRDSRTVRGHELNGSVLWQQELPFTPWVLKRLGSVTLVTSPEGHAMTLDENGDIVGRSREPRENARYFLWRDRHPARMFQAQGTLLVATIDGKLKWRWPEDRPIGGFDVAAGGVWAFFGRTLTHLPFRRITD